MTLLTEEEPQDGRGDDRTSTEGAQVSDEPVAKLAAWVPITTEVGLDMGWWPWLLPDRNPIPRTIRSFLFPRWERANSTIAAVRVRISETWDVLLHGLPDQEDYW